MTAKNVTTALSSVLHFFRVLPEFSLGLLSSEPLVWQEVCMPVYFRYCQREDIFIADTLGVLGIFLAFD